MSAVQAEQAFRRGDWATAERLCDEALAASTEDITAQRVKGMTLARTGRADGAIVHFKQALRLDPNDFLSLEWLQGALMQSGRFMEAVEFGEKARALRPRDVNILIGLSQACFKANLPARAARCLEAARAVEPGNPVVRHLLAQAYEKLKRNRDALGEYREAIRLNPRLGDAHSRASRILLEEGRFAAALRICEQVFRTAPEYGQAHLQAAQALWALERFDEADRAAKTAVRLDPDLAWAAATWLQSCGRVDDARTILENSIRERPVQGRAYYGLVKSRRITEEDGPFVGKLKAILGTEELPLKERVALLRALGKCSDDQGAYEAAMGYFNEAAHLGIRAFAAENAFDPRRLEAALGSLLRLFDRGFLGRHSDLGQAGASPIFVMGMIRSGTTLVQQILTSHPNIGDAGEQPFWTSEFPELVDLDRRELRREAFVEARDQYLEVLKRFDSESPVVANKWPMNYAHAGLLLLAYPRAKIVHVARDPVDTALSIWMTDLGEPRPEFSYVKTHIVTVYRDYQARMNHWSQVLPGEAIFTVRYEDLIQDQETWSRRLIEFCGQEWDERCLSFYEGERRINTPSMLQVRRPIYGSSIGKWRRYEPWLGEFAELLDQP